MNGLRKSLCRSCGEPVIWVVTDGGNSMPIDPTPVEGGNLLLSPAESPPRVSVVSRGGRLAGTKLYVSHFVTCRAAKFHRKPKAQPRRALRPPPEALFSEAGGR